jgi:hypothetical protein
LEEKVEAFFRKKTSMIARNYTHSSGFRRRNSLYRDCRRTRQFIWFRATGLNVDQANSGKHHGNDQSPKTFIISSRGTYFVHLLIYFFNCLATHVEKPPHTSLTTTV